MADKVSVVVTRPFYDRTCFKRLREAGDRLEVSARRADELVGLGLARRSVVPKEA